MTRWCAYAWRRPRIALRGLAVALALMGFVPVAAAAKPQCGHIGAKTTLTRKQVDTMQLQLTELGFNPGRNDGLWGPNTEAALRNFCLSVIFARNDDLQAMLRNHVAIHQAYPDWEVRFESKGFQQWMTRQSDAAHIDRVRQSGNAAQVTKLLRRYEGWRQQAEKRAKPIKKPVKKAVEKAVEKPAEKSVKSAEQPAGQSTATADAVSYVLTKKDLKQLKSNEKLADAIERLATKSYADKDSFKAEAATALKGVPNAHEYVEELAGYGKQHIAYSLGKDSFDALKAKKVPDYILASLDDLQGLQYQAEDFVKAIDAAMSELSAKAMALKPKLVKFAQITPTGARMTKDSLAAMVKAFPKDALVAAVAKWLAARQDITYKSDKALAWAIKVKLMEIEKDIEWAKPMIVEEAERTPLFVIDKAGVNKVADEVRQSVVPGADLKLISGLQGVDYLEKGLFRRAIEARINFSGSENVVMKSIEQAIDQRRAKGIDDALLADWAKAKVLPEIIDELRGLQGKTFASVSAFEKAVQKKLKLLDQKYKKGGYVQRIVAQARKEHAYKGLPIQWDGGGFSCVSRNLAGDVYGFYPYWFAGEHQSIDFGMESRIDYFGVRLNDRGEIANPRHWQDSKDAQAFIREAHTYCAKVDLVVYRRNWKAWKTTFDKKMYFETASKHIADLVTKPLVDPLSQAIPYLTLGMAPVPVMGDGVTLYFPDYPQDQTSIKAFEDFIRELGDRLRATGRHYAVNLMFPSTALGNGIYGYGNLYDLMKDIEGGHQLDARFLILLHEPTTKDKKVVRQQIEDNLHGEKRRMLLRHVAMIITPGGERTQQVDDDVDYAQDNFGGIGFWTQPIMPAAKHVMAALRNHYQVGVGHSVEAVSAVCEIVCPHRWLFRFTWALFALILLAAIPMYMQACKWRVIIDKNFIIILACTVGPFVLLTFALLSCDPALEEISRGNGILFVVIAGIIAYAVWRYREDKRRARLP